MTIRFLIRLSLIFIAPIILFIPTIYATYKELNRLPWGLDSVFGCEEDGWNGNGIDPNNPRQGWQPYKWGEWVEKEDRHGEFYQGWYPDYLGLNWFKLGFWSKWWVGYKWCAFRNVAWNLRLNDWFATSVHHDDIEIDWHEFSTEGHAVLIEWTHKSTNKQYYFKRTRLFRNVYFESGYELRPQLFNDLTSEYKRVREHGYTRGYKYVTRSIPSFRPRAI